MNHPSKTPKIVSDSQQTEVNKQKKGPENPSKSNGGFFGWFFAFSGKGQTHPIVNNLVRAVIIGAIIGLVAMVSLFIYFTKDLPNPANINKRELAQSTKIMDRNGALLYEVHGDENRTIVAIDDLPDYVKNASVAIEDDQFYAHYGFDVLGILRSVYKNTLNRNITGQGGSTITQQFVKNSILTTEKKYSRKIKELILAVEIEWRFNKDEILGMYLNEISYGSSAFGIEAAAQTFYGKPAKDLSVAEAATLASLPNAPSYYSPYGNHPDALLARRNKTIGRMTELGYISQDQAKEATALELGVVEHRFDIKAPHFVFYVREQLESMYGESFVEKGGLQVYTTLDLSMQERAENIVKENADRIRGYGGSNISLVAADPKTGGVLAMVGSIDYFDTENDGNVNVATSNRQPGSSFKPFAYVTAFEKGYGPNTLLFDLETDFGNGYMPRNYSLTQSGPITMRNALARSLNIPAVKALYLAGIDQTIDNTHEFGITTLNDRDRYGLSLVLGGGEVKLVDMVAAYGVWANDGIKNETFSVSKVLDSSGRNIYKHETKGIRVLEPQYARLITDVLADQGARGSFNHSLQINPFPAAAKTGTTQEWRDGWTIGYTTTLAAGVWVGNNDNSSMHQNAPGLSVAAPIWQRFMRESMEGQEVQSFPAADAVPQPKAVLAGKSAQETEVEICNPSRKLATEDCPNEMREKVTYVNVHNILYYVDKDNPLGGYPSSPQNDPQFSAWEGPVGTWAKKDGRVSEDPPTEKDDLHTTDKKPAITITSPDSGDNLSSSLVTVRTNIDSFRPLQRVTFTLDDTPVCQNTGSPFTSCTFALPNGIKNGFHTITVTALDEIYNKSSKDVKVNISGTPITVNVNVTSPATGSSFASANFPVSLSAAVSNGGLVESVTFYYGKVNGSTINTPGTKSGDIYTAQWESYPNSPGTYAVYAIAKLSDKSNVYSGTVSIIIE